MAIILDNYNRITTNFIDFCDALSNLKDGLKCCLGYDIDAIHHTNYNHNPFTNIKLIPLEHFKCKRTIIGNNFNKINVLSTFGLIDDDFIDIDLSMVEMETKSKNIEYGLIVPHSNDYYDMFNQLAYHFNIFGKDVENSFILDIVELDKLKHVPFTLKYENYKLNVSNIGNKLKEQEYNDLVDELYCSDYGL